MRPAGRREAPNSRRQDASRPLRRPAASATGHGGSRAERPRLPPDAPARKWKRVGAGRQVSVIVSVRGLGFAYPAIDPGGETPWVLDRVDLDIERGELLSVMGPTGAGKTTLCLALVGIVPQSTGGLIRGEVRVDGLDTKTEPVASLAGRVGVVFQDPETQLFNMNVEAEIAFGLENKGVAPEEIAERIDWAARTVGIDGLLGRSPFELSGGQKQRVAIAAVLAMRPEVLVLDEPTASLDPRGKQEVFAAVRDLRRQRGMTIVMVEQDAERIAEFSDRVAVLAGGRVWGSGTPAEVFARAGELASLGLRVPQVTEVAERLNRRHGTAHRFTRLEEAARSLARELEASRFAGKSAPAASP